MENILVYQMHLQNGYRGNEQSGALPVNIWLGGWCTWSLIQTGRWGYNPGDTSINYGYINPTVTPASGTRLRFNSLYVWWDATPTQYQPYHAYDFKWSVYASNDNVNWTILGTWEIENTNDYSDGRQDLAANDAKNPTDALIKGRDWSNPFIINNNTSAPVEDIHLLTIIFILFI